MTVREARAKSKQYLVLIRSDFSMRHHCSESREASNGKPRCSHLMEHPKPATLSSPLLALLGFLLISAPGPETTEVDQDVQDEVVRSPPMRHRRPFRGLKGTPCTLPSRSAA